MVSVLDHWHLLAQVRNSVTHFQCNFCIRGRSNRKLGLTNLLECICGVGFIWVVLVDNRNDMWKSFLGEACRALDVVVPR